MGTKDELTNLNLLVKTKHVNIGLNEMVQIKEESFI